MALQVPKRALQKRRKSANGVRVTAMAATGVIDRSAARTDSDAAAAVAPEGQGEPLNARSVDASGSRQGQGAETAPQMQASATQATAAQEEAPRRSYFAAAAPAPQATAPAMALPAATEPAVASGSIGSRAAFGCRCRQPCPDDCRSARVQSCTGTGVHACCSIAGNRSRNALGR